MIDQGKEHVNCVSGWGLQKAEIKVKKIYIDRPCFHNAIERDDFIVCVGVRKTNSVYHVVNVTRITTRMEGRINRFHLEVINTDLMTALNRDPDQQLIPMTWYKRSKKSKSK